MDEWDQIEVAEENGILRVQHIRRAPLRIGLLFTIINRQIQIDVPREYAGSVQVETKNGAIRLEEMKQLAQVGCHARNGAVRLAGCCVQALAIEAVSYTHLTLPTIYSVEISAVAVSLKKKKKPNTRNESYTHKTTTINEQT